MRIMFTLFFLVCLITAKSQLLTWSPDFIREASDPIEITVDAAKGNQGLKDYSATSDVYVHIGVITNLTQIAANQTVIGVVVEFHLFCVPVCVLQIFFW